jgi:adenylate cyclase
MRIGIDYGPLISGVIGQRQRFFDIWGDTVNTAARVQAVGRPQTINLSERAYETVQSRFPEAEAHAMAIKGKGILALYELTASTEPEPEPVS